jgi:hypothetical protein
MLLSGVDVEGVVLADLDLPGGVVLHVTRLLKGYEEHGVFMWAIVDEEQSLPVSVWSGDPKHLLYLVDGGHRLLLRFGNTISTPMITMTDRYTTVSAAVAVIWTWH